MICIQYSIVDVYSKLSKISSQRRCQSVYKQTVKRKFGENQGNFKIYIFFNTFVLVNRAQYNPKHEYVILFTIGPLGRTESPGIQRLGLLFIL